MTKVRISATLTEQEWNWLRAKLNNEFLDSETAQSIKSKLTINKIREADATTQKIKR